MADEGYNLLSIMINTKDALVTLLCRALGFFVSPFNRPPKVPLAVISILIIKPCCIGDLVLATPTIAHVRRAFPEAAVTVATGPWSKGIADRIPGIKALDMGHVGPGSRTRLGDYLALVALLRRSNFRLCLVLDRSPLITLLPLLSGIPLRAGLDSRGRGFPLNIKVPVAEGRHEAELYLDVASALGVGISDAQLEFSLLQEDMEWSRKRTRPEDGPMVAFHPGGGVNPGSALVEKRWPLERYRELAGRFLQQGYRIVVVGDQGEREAGQYLSKLDQAGSGDKMINIAGETSLGQLGAAVSLCRLFVGNDSGPIHIAAAVGTPVIALFGPSKPQNYAPYTEKKVVLYKGEHCSGCEFRGGLLQRCRNNLRCMQEISVQEVWEAAQELLKVGSPEGRSRRIPSGGGPGGAHL